MESDRLKNGWFWPVSAGRESSSLSLSVAPKYQRSFSLNSLLL